MATIYADFNACAADGRIWLDTVGSKKSLAQTGARPGDWVWLSDEELRVGGKIEEGESGLVASVAWETLEELDLGDEDPRDLQEASLQFHELIDQPESQRDYRQILRVLPRIEPALAEAPGQANFLRAMAAFNLGYPGLALLAIEDALREKTDDPDFLFFRLILLQRSDQDRARQEAERFIAIRGLPAPLLAACISVFAARVPDLQGEERRRLVRRILGLTSRFDLASGRHTLSNEIVTFVHDVRRATLSDMESHRRCAVSRFGDGGHQGLGECRP